MWDRATPPERHDLAGLGCRAIGGPCFHQLPPLVEKIATPVRRFDLVLDHMRLGSRVHEFHDK